MYEDMKSVKPNGIEFDMSHTEPYMKIVKSLKLGVNDYHVGSSNYSDMDISPWDVMQSMGILESYLKGDIIKRVMRTKDGEDKTLDWNKIKHICDKLIELENSDGSVCSDI